MAGRITKAVEDAVAKQAAKNCEQGADQSHQHVDRRRSQGRHQGIHPQFVPPKVATLIKGGTDHADAFFEAQADAAIDAGKEGEEAVLKRQGNIAAMATTDKKAPIAAADAAL